MPTERAFAELTRQEKAIELLRWIAVLPAAILARFLIRLMVAWPIYLAGLGPWFAGAESVVTLTLQLLLFYFPKQVAFVVAGAKMAPRGNKTVAVLLAIAACLLSLTIHILVQSHRGILNYSHFTAESLGAISGAAYIFFSEAKPRQTNYRPV